MAERTKDPWAFEECPAVIALRAGDRRLGDLYATGTPDTPGAYNRPSDEDRANARLIVAAPDLLRALEAILPMAEVYAASNDVGNNQELVDWASDIAAKAAGKKPCPPFCGTYDDGASV